MTVPANLPPEQVDPSLITDNVRRVVYLEDCERNGHQYLFKDAISLGEKPNPNNEGGWPNLEVKAREEGKMPHIVCPNCKSVWIIIDDPGFGYDDAIRKVQKRMGNPSNPQALKPRPMRERIMAIREELRQERVHVGKLIPTAVMRKNEEGYMQSDVVGKIPNYLQPRGRNK